MINAIIYITGVVMWILFIAMVFLLIIIPCTRVLIEELFNKGE